MSDRVVIDGDMSLTSTIDGEGNAFIRIGQNPVIVPLNALENGTYDLLDGVDGYAPVTVAIPEYEGAYTVVPTTEVQTLPTAGKVMAQDVTVGKVEPVLWKTITLEEDHLKDDIGNPVYWFDFLEIPYQDVVDGWIYFVDFSGNQDTSQYRVMRGWYDNRDVNTITSPISCVFVRGTVAMAIYRNKYSLYATAGTVIKVYRFKQQEVVHL